MRLMPTFADEVFHHILRQGLIPIDITAQIVGHLALSIEDKGGGQYIDGEKTPQGTGGIGIEVEMTDLQALEKWARGGNTLGIQGDGQDLKPLGIELALQPVEGGQLTNAGRTPGGPKIEQGDAPLELVQAGTRT